MRSFKDGDEIWLEPFRAKAFPIVKDLVVDRSSSMKYTDLDERRSRLEVVKEVVGDFVIVEARSVDNNLMCPLDICNLDGSAGLEFNGQEVKWNLTNVGDANVAIDSIAVAGHEITEIADLLVKHAPDLFAEIEEHIAAGDLAAVPAAAAAGSATPGLCGASGSVKRKVVRLPSSFSNAIVAPVARSASVRSSTKVSALESTTCSAPREAIKPAGEPCAITRP